MSQKVPQFEEKILDIFAHYLNRELGSESLAVHFHHLQPVLSFPPHLRVLHHRYFHLRLKETFQSWQQDETLTCFTAFLKILPLAGLGTAARLSLDKMHLVTSSRKSFG